MFQTVSTDQDYILKAINTLHMDEWYQVDLTFGKGSFWRKSMLPEKCCDISPQFKNVEAIDSMSMPWKTSSIKSIVFDPPFLTYIKPGKSILGKRFSGYWKYEELEDHYVKTFEECSRVLVRGGILVVKCQDIIHNHRLHPTHINVAKWAEAVKLKLKDLFILHAKNRMPTKAAPHGKQTQKHARIHHSYFMVFIKDEAGRKDIGL